MNKEDLDLQEVQFEKERYLKITDHDETRPFFMSIVSYSNHWMFISSNGGLSCGRKDAEHALFPYYTDDKITENCENTGPKTIIILEEEDGQIWEPFSVRSEGRFNTQRNLYKNVLGNKILFEEINHDLKLTFRYQWCSSNKYGFVRRSFISNDGEAEKSVNILDGLQNLMPSAVGSFIQNHSSNLVDAYKRSQLVLKTGLGIFALSAIIVDKAEPSEALKANIAYAIGLSDCKYLISNRQLSAFRKTGTVQTEKDVKAERGAFLLHKKISLPAGSEEEWMIVADVNKNHSQVASINRELEDRKSLKESIKQDIEDGSEKLIALNASSDALQLSSDKFRDARHFSNTLFNIMRGGIFDSNYTVEKDDFSNYLTKANKHIYELHKKLIESLPKKCAHSELVDRIKKASDQDLDRLTLEYMPLKFSRRHGDPSRPWNKFSINTQNEVDGSKILDYEGNWRDIFQNWEALSISYPGFVISMIVKFLNASTFDGYNPYRVTKGGFDWEVIEPDDPWSYIGYWGDHQVIYLQKLLEIANAHYPGSLEQFFEREIFVYANVPYKIKSYEDIVKNPKDTIDFDFESQEIIERNREKIGADGALLKSANGNVVRVNFIEKLLALFLSKMSNFIPEGGIWMNTQRPEWNDANNALVGNGVSMVTLCYMRRFIQFWLDLFEGKEEKTVKISKELKSCFDSIMNTLVNQEVNLNSSFSDQSRKTCVDSLGQAGSAYRNSIYGQSFSDEREEIQFTKLKDFLAICLRFVDHTISKNKRSDQLYHAYNLISIEEDKAVIDHLSEMLEGQVAVLSSGLLSAMETIEVLDAMKTSALFRKDQYSYLLYPNKDLPQFTEKNVIPEDKVSASELLSTLIDDGDRSIIEKDVKGAFHFNGGFKNANDLANALSALSEDKYGALKENESDQILEIFESLFDHKSFTGRSGTFYGYEGLGSIYWHMVSKLQVAVFESCKKAIEGNEDAETIGRLLAHYYEINAGIGVHKSPRLYGAFPTDPYSHTPAGKGAQQPGMTGQVKEDILSRFGELGVQVEKGQIHFKPAMLRKSEFLSEQKEFQYFDIEGTAKSLSVNPNELAFTYCQVPIIYTKSSDSSITIHKRDGSTSTLPSWILSKEDSNAIFERSGAIEVIKVSVEEHILK